MSLGAAGDQYSVGYLDEPMRSHVSTMEAWPVWEGPTPIPLSQPLHRNEMDTDNVLLFLQVPEEAAEAELTITGRIENLIEPVETAQGEKMAEGVWMFRYPIARELSADYTAGRPVRYGGRSLEELPYTLELYREDGSLLWEQSGICPTADWRTPIPPRFTHLTTRFPHRPGGPGPAGKERRLAPWNTTKLQTPPASGWTEPRQASVSAPTGRRSGRSWDAHLDDKIQDLQRIFPDLSAWEATQMALSGMGDPEEIGRELAKLHKPWLGYLWRASQITLGVVLAVGVCQFGGWLWTQVTIPNVGGTQDSWAVEIPFSGGTVQAGQYTIQAEGTLCLLEQGDDLGTLEVTWRASSPRFWESPSYNEYWWAEDDQGNVYISRAEGRMSNVLRGLVVDQNGHNRYREVYGPSWRRSGWGGGMTAG